MPLTGAYGYFLAIPVFDYGVVVNQPALPALYRGNGETPFPAPRHQQGLIMLAKRAEDSLHAVP
jgi:hypothetical protein